MCSNSMEVFSSRRDSLKKPTFYLLGYTPKGAISVPRTRLNECLMPRVVPPHEQHKAAVALLKDQEFSYLLPSGWGISHATTLEIVDRKHLLLLASSSKVLNFRNSFAFKTHNTVVHNVQMEKAKNISERRGLYEDRGGFLF